MEVTCPFASWGFGVIWDSVCVGNFRRLTCVEMKTGIELLQDKEYLEISQNFGVQGHF